MSGGVKVGMVKCGFFWLRLLLRVSTTPTTSLVVVGKAKSEISSCCGTAARSRAMVSHARGPEFDSASGLHPHVGVKPVMSYIHLRSGPVVRLGCLRAL